MIEQGTCGSCVHYHRAVDVHPCCDCKRTGRGDSTNWRPFICTEKGLKLSCNKKTAELLGALIRLGEAEAKYYSDWEGRHVD